MVDRSAKQNSGLYSLLLKSVSRFSIRAVMASYICPLLDSDVLVCEGKVAKGIQLDCSPGSVGRDVIPHLPIKVWGCIRGEGHGLSS